MMSIVPLSLLLRTLLLVSMTTAAIAAVTQTPRLLTQWASKVDPNRPLPEYPRPQMVRNDWLNLNGKWDFGMGAEPNFEGKIVVPYPIESHLSGVAKPLAPNDKAYYRRTFRVPSTWRGKKVILHFGAVDWEARVKVNGKDVGSHRGGFDPFAFDITSALVAGDEQEITVEVTDPTDSSWQPRGKQVLKPGGIFYTPSSGIWQTVWVEPVANASIETLRITPDVATSSVKVSAPLRGTGAAKVWAEVLDGDRRVSRVEVTAGQDITLKVPRPKLWTPDRPFLYTLKVGVTDAKGRQIDAVDSYFGMRTISVGPDSKGVTRLLLNGKPVFQFGLLDQGFWPDGLLTAPTDEALKYDLDVTKKLGFNMVRKHVKVEPARWYYHCDKMGLLVWQDMPSGDKYIGSSDPDLVRSPASAANYEYELSNMIRSLYNSPSIVMWVVFNEGWGQFDTSRIAAMTKALDPTRLVNSASGWTERGVGDVIDYHVYPGPGSPNPEAGRAAVLGEFGGLGLPVRDHTWIDENNWGYRSYTTKEALTEALVANIRQLRLLVGTPGLSAAVYTQTTDVETEVNGLLTYDRALLKPDERALKDAIASVFKPSPKLVEIVPTAETASPTWRYSLQAPAADWFKPGFDDSRWATGPGGFGTPETPGTIVRTRWDSNEIWLRRTFKLSKEVQFQDPHLRIHHDEDAEVYLDGQLIAKLSGHTSAYVYVPIPKRLLASLAAGEHTLAVSCKQTRGGQYIDVGIVDIADR